MTEPFPESAPDFDDPLGLLRACHQRMLAQCDLLEKLATHLQMNGVDADARTAARRVQTYFSTAAVHHHQDEEQDVFPRVVRSSLKMATVIHELKQDHEKLAAAWNDIGPMLGQLQHIGDTTRFRALVHGFCQAYREHIQIEEEDFLDVAQHILSSDDLRAIGKSMRERRQAPAREED